MCAVRHQYRPVAANEGGADRKGRYQPRNGPYCLHIVCTDTSVRDTRKPHKLVSACSTVLYQSVLSRTRTVNLLLDEQQDDVLSREPHPGHVDHQIQDPPDGDPINRHRQQQRPHTLVEVPSAERLEHVNDSADRLHRGPPAKRRASARTARWAQLPGRHGVLAAKTRPEPVAVRRRREESLAWGRWAGRCLSTRPDRRARTRATIRRCASDGLAARAGRHAGRLHERRPTREIGPTERGMERGMSGRNRGGRVHTIATPWTTPRSLASLSSPPGRLGIRRYSHPCGFPETATGDFCRSSSAGPSRSS